MRRAGLAVFLVVVTPAAVAGQTFSHRGFGETLLTAHPQTTPADDTRVIGEARFRWEPGVRLGDWRLDATFDARMDTHHQTQRSGAVTFWDRTVRRPAFSVARLSASWARGPATLVVGKQFLRWGKTDILVPTDRFAPRDYLSIIEPELLAVTAARLTLASSSDSFDVAITPRMTPTRAPLLDQRWVVVPRAARAFELSDRGATYPRKAQFGVRWNHLGRRLEHSLSFFRGFNHLPLFEATVLGRQLEIQRTYTQLTTLGADMAAPLPWFTVKAEASWFSSEDAAAGEYLLYVVQLERQIGEWLIIAGYAGEHEEKAATPFRFAPDRGLARAFVARASLTIDASRTLVLEGVARQSGDGLYARLEYSHSIADHWRAVATVTGFAGAEEDFLGRYERNSFARLTLRYSF